MNGVDGLALPPWKALPSLIGHSTSWAPEAGMEVFFLCSWYRASL